MVLQTTQHPHADRKAALPDIPREAEPGAALQQVSGRELRRPARIVAWTLAITMAMPSIVGG